MQRIFIVEDDENIRELVAYALKSAGFETMSFESAPTFWKALSAELPTLILLDIMLPGEDGISILTKLRGELRTRGVPVIMLTAKSSEYDKVRGLDAGADDYIAKPFGVMELISRIKAILRRVGAEDGKEEALRHRGICLDPEKRMVTVDEVETALTYKEFELLQYLLKNKGIVMSRDKIMERSWGFDFEGESRTVDMHVKTLRQKLGEGSAIIETVRGVGYRAAL